VLCCTVLHGFLFQVPVVFFSLLRKGTPDRDRSEAKLAEAFDYVSGWYSNRCACVCGGGGGGGKPPCRSNSVVVTQPLPWLWHEVM
jgi:hypothetical protein